ncbi:MAG: hypothetical protein GW762_00515 [Candidatus Pacebacteria bacterium]|nr:hypothetical protein [Candidatus Paceibacterota bacterium]PIR63678.1 MAG: hypothetical protein COU64_03010 [Candidatus Pacebacteria bacterium CG10_big_fil_rev_8_21_14_0_10_40_26]PIZ79681.1 MAG: hypothetical protein COY01_00050 [Candidatus Pacebacteria bacterium CG_4_10_14_0_2_um_filter_40_20]PJA68325.1 MAG: hypothetical protein CO156_05005 [Candidatus Pacebacteria bacterium CG_4_9_14_3_um_filter_40_12]PJC41187.1 MAG: hypothetical protein CO041_05075 [Candidatus Pacebacteria bacterium CG_4_9_
MLFQLILNPTTQFTQADATGFVLAIFKWMLVIVAILYMFVAVIITRQIGLMHATVSTPHTVRLRLISLVHLALSGVLLLYFVLFL